MLIMYSFMRHDHLKFINHSRARQHEKDTNARRKSAREQNKPTRINCRYKVIHRCAQALNMTLIEAVVEIKTMYFD